MTGYLLMSEKERERKAILSQVASGHFSLKEAANRLLVSYGQVKRLWKRYQALGDAGLIHRSRGRASNHQKPVALKQSVLACYQRDYVGFGPTLAAEKLQAQGYAINHETLRRWLIQAGLWQGNVQRVKHRRRRLRKACFGELLQLDGSHHAWFGEDTPSCCLMNLVDDATGITLSLLAEQETTQAALEVLLAWVKRYGLPKALYVDLKSVYIGQRQKVNIEDELAGRRFTDSVFGKVCNTLGIVLIKAYSPQAKGRVERSHGVYQDRLVKEIQLQQLTTISQVNDLLDREFIDGLNQRFAKAPACEQDAHRSVEAYGDLDLIFCWQSTRQIQQDSTFCYAGQIYLLDKTNPVKAKQRVLIKRHLDGSLSVWYQHQRLSYQRIEARPQHILENKPVYTSQQRSQKAKQSKHQSPWNQFNPGWLRRV